jgi:hypothetical protein
MEPRDVAYEKKADVDAAHARMLKVLLTEGHYPAIATHDPAMIDLARRWAVEHGISSDRFEFQMLYGIRRDLQATLAKDGYRMRVYVPFGREWFPYFMRRLGERPANLGFVIRGLLHDAGDSLPTPARSASFDLSRGTRCSAGRHRRKRSYRYLAHVTGRGMTLEANPFGRPFSRRPA